MQTERRRKRKACYTGVTDMLTERQIHILAILSEQSLTCSEIARQLSVSAGTVRNDLARIEEHLENTGNGLLVRKPGVGVSLKRNYRRKSPAKDGESLVVGERGCYIGLRLLKTREGEAVTETRLAEELYVSRSSVRRELELLEEPFSKLGLVIRKRKNQGVMVEGSEFNRRIAWKELAFARIERHRQGTEFKKELAILLPGVDLAAVERLIQALEQRYDAIGDPHKHLELLIHIGLSLYRSSQGCAVSLEGKSTVWQQVQEIGGFVEDFEQIWKREIGRYMPSQEKEYICLYVFFSGILKSRGVDFQRQKMLTSPEFEAFLQEFDQVVQSICGIDITGDERLLEAFRYHLSGLIFRMKNGLRMKNPLLRQIKTGYPGTYGAAWFSSFLFEKYFGIVVTDDEIAYLTTYLAAAREHLRPVISVCLVCNYGLSVSQLLCERLRHSIPEIQVMDILSYERFQELSRKGEIGWDVVISTVGDLDQSRPILYISPILSAAEEQTIRGFMRDFHQLPAPPEREDRPDIPPDRGGLTEYSGEPAWDICSPQLVLLDMEADGKDKVIASLCRLLEREGRVTAGFEESVKNREKMVSTEMGGGFAIPHGNSGCVLRTSVAVARLEKRIPWSSGERVDTVFLIACSSQKDGYGAAAMDSLKQFYRRLAVLLEKKEEQQQFRGKRDAEAVSNFINGKEQRREK